MLKQIANLIGEISASQHDWDINCRALKKELQEKTERQGSDCGRNNICMQFYIIYAVKNRHLGL